jgi:hypothetical protein
MTYEITATDRAEMEAFLLEIYGDEEAEAELERREAADEADLFADEAFLDNL